MRLTALAVLFSLLFAATASAQTSTWKITFAPNPAHATPQVVSYDYILTPFGGAPLPPQPLGKPTPVANVISVDVTAYVNALPPATYTGVVRATGPGGVAASVPGASFTITVPPPDPQGPPTFTRTQAAVADKAFHLWFDHYGAAVPDRYDLRQNGQQVASQPLQAPFAFPQGLPAGRYVFDVTAVYGAASYTSETLEVIVS
jgi:hypothetical protein